MLYETEKRKKNWHRFPVLYIAVMAVGATVFLSSCAKEDDNASDDRDKYLGSWVCNESIQGGPSSTYNITITKDVTSSNAVKAEGFYGLGAGAFTFIVIDGNNMTIQNQSISGNTLSGSGTYSNNTFSMHFSADDGQTVEQVTVNAHR